MTKKQMNKKKINLKLVIGESAIVLSYDTLMHIAETYDFLATEQEDDYDANWYREVADTIRFQSSENYFYKDEDDEYENW